MDIIPVNKNKGFSLVELIIVIAIMAILAAAIAPALIRYIEKSRKSVDVQMASTIGKAVDLAISEGDSNQSGNGPEDMLEMWRLTDAACVQYAVTDDDGNHYNVRCVCQWIYNTNNGEFVNGGTTQHDVFVDIVNNNAGTPVKNLIKYRKGPGGTSLDRVIVARNEINDEVEVWVGTGSGGSGSCCYRLYPNPSKEYK